jgi:hypothetical protein
MMIEFARRQRALPHLRVLSFGGCRGGDEDEHAGPRGASQEELTGTGTRRSRWQSQALKCADAGRR